MPRQTPIQKFHDSAERCIVALDGTSASGKGTLAKIIAQRYSFEHCQSSIFYRQLALERLNDGATDLYSESVTRMTSIIAAFPEVRQQLLKPQRDFLQEHPRVIMEGRDIGTVIAPDADIKIYITAKPEVRAQRRYDQLIAGGKNVIYGDILTNLMERDERDQHRETAPLMKAEDAIEIDTSYMSIEQVLEKLIQEIKGL
jgi:cytidylate kinase